MEYSYFEVRLNRERAAQKSLVLTDAKVSPEVGLAAISAAL